MHGPMNIKYHIIYHIIS